MQFMRGSGRLDNAYMFGELKRYAAPPNGSSRRLTFKIEEFVKVARP
jgi:hypothetical protein